MKTIDTPALTTPGKAKPMRKTPTSATLARVVQSAPSRTVNELAPGSAFYGGATKGVQAHDAIVAGISGLVFNDFVRTFERVPIKALLLAIGVSERTAQRIKTQPTKVLDSRTSDGLVKVASVRALAAQVLGGTAAADEWLNSEAMGLEFRKPIDLLSTTPGVEMVTTLLQRMRYGVYT